MTLKCLCIFLFATNFVAMANAIVDENVQAAQSRLQDNGFYSGKITGRFDSETSAALTRYQIRHGLAINGQLDAATAHALGVQPNEKLTAPDAETWRQLRQSDEQFLKRLNDRATATPSATPAPPKPQVAATSIPRTTTENAAIDPHAPPPPPPENPPPAPPTPEPIRSALETTGSLSRERLRDYIAAFVLAGLAPKVGAELEFFADRVDYFGETNAGREKIRHDLIRYDQRWPERHFTLAGDLVITPQQNGRVRVAFPLRYDLRSPREHVSGLVRKTLTLQRTGQKDLEIIVVNEEKTSR